MELGVSGHTVIVYATYLITKYNFKLVFAFSLNIGKARYLYCIEREREKKFITYYQYVKAMINQVYLSNK